MSNLKGGVPSLNDFVRKAYVWVNFTVLVGSKSSKGLNNNSGFAKGTKITEMRVGNTLAGNKMP